MKKKDFPKSRLDLIVDHIMEKMREIEQADEASIRKELRRQISDQIFVHYAAFIDEQVEKEIEKLEKPKSRLEQLQDQIWQIAESQGNTKGLARQHVKKLIDKPVTLPDVQAEYVYNYIKIGKICFDKPFNKKHIRGRASWAKWMYDVLAPALSVPEAADYMSKIAKYIYGKNYKKRSIERVLHRSSSETSPNS